METSEYSVVIPREMRNIALAIIIIIITVVVVMKY